jgi:hypothetical protein
MCSKARRKNVRAASASRRFYTSMSDLAVLVDSLIDVTPGAAHFDVCFVHELFRPRTVSSTNCFVHEPPVTGRGPLEAGCVAAFLQNLRPRLRTRHRNDPPYDSHRVDRTRDGALHRRPSGFTMPDRGIMHLAHHRQLVRVRTRHCVPIHVRWPAVTFVLVTFGRLGRPKCCH